MDWDAYIASLNRAEQAEAQRLVREYGREATDGHVRYHPVGSVGELESELRRKQNRVRVEVPGLYESINVHQTPTGWSVTNTPLQTEPNGTTVVQMDVTGPNGAIGFFERAYHPANQRLELRRAFLRLAGATEELPGWVRESGVPMLPPSGTPTVQYFTLYQLRLLRVPAGRRVWWRRWLHRLRMRAGPFAVPGVVSSIKMSTIQNIETILHLHWLTQRHPGRDPSELIGHTASVQYAETTAVLCGYRVTEVRYVPGDEWDGPIGHLMDYYEDHNPRQRAENDRKLARYTLTRATVMKQNFDIELGVEPS